MSRGRKRADDDVTGCLAYVLLGLFFMPIVGLYFVLGIQNQTADVQSNRSLPFHGQGLAAQALGKLE